MSLKYINCSTDTLVWAPTVSHLGDKDFLLLLITTHSKTPTALNGLPETDTQLDLPYLLQHCYSTLKLAKVMWQEAPL